MKKNVISKDVNAIRNRKSGNVLIKHYDEEKEKNIYFWLLKKDGTIVVTTKDGHRVNAAGWFFMANPTQGNGVLVKNYPVTKNMLEKYYQAEELLTTGKKRIADFNRKKAAAKSRFNKENQKKIVKKNNSNLKKRTFGDLKSLQELKKKLEMAS